MLLCFFQYPLGDEDFTGIFKQNIGILRTINLNGKVLTALHENN